MPVSLGGRTAGDGTAAAGLEPVPLGGMLACRMPVHPASPAPVTAAPDRSRNFRRSIGTCSTVLTARRPHHPPGRAPHPERSITQVAHSDLPSPARSQRDVRVLVTEYAMTQLEQRLLPLAVCRLAEWRQQRPENDRDEIEQPDRHADRRPHDAEYDDRQYYGETARALSPVPAVARSGGSGTAPPSCPRRWKGRRSPATPRFRAPGFVRAVYLRPSA